MNVDEWWCPVVMTKELSTRNHHFFLLPAKVPGIRYQKYMTYIHVVPVPVHVYQY